MFCALGNTTESGCEQGRTRKRTTSLLMKKRVDVLTGSCGAVRSGSRLETSEATSSSSTAEVRLRSPKELTESTEDVDEREPERLRNETAWLSERQSADIVRGGRGGPSQNRCVLLRSDRGSYVWRWALEEDYGPNVTRGAASTP